LSETEIKARWILMRSKPLGCWREEWLVTSDE
jgi:hypothetical protein